MKLSSPTTDLVAKIALKWWEKRPFSEEGKARRKARRAQRKAERRARRKGVELSGESTEYEVTEDRGMSIDIGTRTSTNALVGGGILSTIYVQLIGLLPFPGLVAALTTPEAIALAATAFAWIVARFSKTPPNPGVI